MYDPVADDENTPLWNYYGHNNRYGDVRHWGHDGVNFHHNYWNNHGHWTNWRHNGNFHDDTDDYSQHNIKNYGGRRYGNVLYPNFTPSDDAMWNDWNGWHSWNGGRNYNGWSRYGGLGHWGNNWGWNGWRRFNTDRDITVKAEPLYKEGEK